MERVTAALRAVALDKFASALEDEGYDDFDVLKKESEADRAQIAKDVGMTDEEASKFVAMFDAPPPERAKPVAKPPPPPPPPETSGQAPGSVAEALAGFKAAQSTLVRALQNEFYCDDLEPPANAFGWTPDQYYAFYESGGEMPSEGAAAAVSTTDAALMELLDSDKALAKYKDTLSKCTWAEFEAVNEEGRQAMLEKLTNYGLKLPDRSKFANAFNKAVMASKVSDKVPGGGRPQTNEKTVAPLYDAKGRTYEEIANDVKGYQRCVLRDGMPNRDNGLFANDDPFLLLLTRTGMKPCIKGLPFPTKDGKGVEFKLVEEGWATGENACMHGMDLRTFIKPGFEEKKMDAAVRFSERVTFAVGLNGSVHGGAIETCFDEITAECAKAKCFPLVLTSKIECKMIKELKPYTTYRVTAKVDNERVPGKIVEVSAEITDTSAHDVLATCKTTIVNIFIVAETRAGTPAAAGTIAEAVSATAAEAAKPIS